MGNSEKGQINFKKVIAVSWAIVAFLIGSGYATGQEALQYFAVFGINYAIYGLFITLLIYLWFTREVMARGNKLKLQNPYHIYRYYCGAVLGFFFEIYTPFFLYLVFIIMLAAGGAIVSEEFAVANIIGRTLLLLPISTSVLFGFKKNINIVAKIAPFIVFSTVLIGLYSFIYNVNNLSYMSNSLFNMQLIKASEKWYMAAILYPAMGALFLCAFLARIGQSLASPKEAGISGMLGGLAFVLATTILALGILANIHYLSLKEIPTLFVAESISPVVGQFFAFVLLLGIYAACAPILWMSVHAFCADEKKTLYKILVIIFAFVGLILSQFSFTKLVNLLYPLTGYLSLVLLVCIFWKSILKKD